MIDWHGIRVQQSGADILIEARAYGRCGATAWSSSAHGQGRGCHLRCGAGADVDVHPEPEGERHSQGPDKIQLKNARSACAHLFMQTRSAPLTRGALLLVNL